MSYLLVTWLSLKGRFERWRRDMKRPRQRVAYLIGLLLIVLMLAPALGLLGSGFGQKAASSVTSDDVIPESILALVLTLSAIWLWLKLPARPALWLSEAEANWLLPAPLSRRSVIDYSLLRTQPTLALGSLVLCMFAHSSLKGHSFLGIWLAIHSLMFLASLHGIACASTKACTRALHPASRGIWRGLGLGLLATYSAALLWGCTDAAVELVAALRAVAAQPHQLTAFLDEARSVGHGSVLVTILAPARLLLLPFFGDDWLQVTAGYLILFTGIAVHREWIVRSMARFEDATIERARAAGKRGVRGTSLAGLHPERRQQAPFRLPDEPRPVIALAWKSCLAAYRGSLLRLAMRWLVAITLVSLAIAMFAPVRPLVAIMGITGAVVGSTYAFFSSAIWGNDIRAELDHLDVVRAWPVSSLQIARADVLAPSLLATLHSMFGCGILVAAELTLRLARSLGRIGDDFLTPSERLATLLDSSPLAVTIMVVVAFAIVCSGFAHLSTALQSLAALRAPGFFPRPATAPESIASTGSRMIGSAILSMTLTIGAFPGLCGAMIVLFLGITLTPPLGLGTPLVAALALAVTLHAEAWVCHGLVARQWQNLDAASEHLQP